jgi:hypothetical protein
MGATRIAKPRNRQATDRAPGIYPQPGFQMHVLSTSADIAIIGGGARRGQDLRPAYGGQPPPVQRRLRGRHISAHLPHDYERRMKRDSAGSSSLFMQQVTIRFVLLIALALTPAHSETYQFFTINQKVFRHLMGAKLGAKH